VVKGTNPEEYLKSASPDSPMGKVYRKTMMNNPSASAESFLSAKERLLSDPNALQFASFLTYHGELNLKPLIRLEDSVISHNAIALQPNSEFREMLNFHLVQLFESGVLNSLERYKWYLTKLLYFSRVHNNLEHFS